MADDTWESISGSFTRLRDDRNDAVFPWLMQWLGKADVRTLLDYGCGDGVFAQLAMQQLNLTRVVCYDKAASMRMLAARRLAGSEASVAADVAEIGSQRFDVVAFNAVWMCLETDEQCVAVLREMTGLLADGGVILATVTHPYFRHAALSTYRTDFDPSRYGEDGVRFRVFMPPDDPQVTFEDTHWRLPTMIDQALRAGLRLDWLEEFEDSKKPGLFAWMTLALRRC